MGPVAATRGHSPHAIEQINGISNEPIRPWRTDPYQQVDQGLDRYVTGRGNLATGYVQEHLELGSFGDAGRRVTPGELLTDHLRLGMVEDTLIRPRSAVGHEQTKDAFGVLVIYGCSDEPSLGGAAEDRRGNPEMIKQCHEVVRDVLNGELEVGYPREAVTAVVYGDDPIPRL